MLKRLRLRLWPCGERGAGSILVVAIIGTVVSLALLSAPLSTVLVAKGQLAAATDAAALAAADVSVGRVPGEPCQVAAVVANANGATVTGCKADGLVVTVQAGSSALGFELVATATAGPP